MTSLGFRRSFLGLKGPSQNLVFFFESGYQYFDKFNFKLSFSALISAIVLILRTKQNEMFHLQWIGRLDVTGRHTCVSVGLWERSIKISFPFCFIKISRNGKWFLLYSIVNCIKGLIEFKESNNSSGLIWLIIKIYSSHPKTSSSFP